MLYQLSYTRNRADLARCWRAVNAIVVMRCLALRSIGDFEVVFLASPFIYNGLNNAEMLAGLMACAERHLDDFDISSP